MRSEPLNSVPLLLLFAVACALTGLAAMSIWVGLFALSVLAMASVGYQDGLSATRRSPAMLGLVLAFSGVLFLIADLDRPGEGFLTVNQQAMVDVQKSMATGKP